MSKSKRLALVVIVGLLMLWIGLVDDTDPTPAVIRLPIGLAASVALVWLVWKMSGRTGTW